MNNLQVHDVKKIAVLRANALGDFIVTLPALHALKSLYPQAELTLLGKPWHAEFLVKGRTPVDRVITVPVMQGIRSEQHQTEDASEVEEFFARMREEQFDLAINFQGGGEFSNAFIRNLGAKLTLGAANEHCEKPDRWIPYYYYQQEVFRYLEIVRLAGATTTQIEPKLNVLPQDVEEVQNLISSLAGSPYVILNATTNDPRRSWPYANFVTIGDALYEKGFEIIFNGSPNDKKVVDRIISEMQHTALNVCGISLGGLAALAARAALVISADTGPLHLAQAVGSATVGLYWACNLVNWGPVFRAKDRPLVSWKLECPLCGTIPNDPYPFEPMDNCAHNVSFIEDIMCEDVLAAALRLLGKNEFQVKPILNESININRSL